MKRSNRHTWKKIALAAVSSSNAAICVPIFATGFLADSSLCNCAVAQDPVPASGDNPDKTPAGNQDPNVQRPDSQRPDGQRSDGQRADGERPNADRPNRERPGMLQRPGQGRGGQGGPGGGNRPGQNGIGRPGAMGEGRPGGGGISPQAMALFFRNLPVMKTLDVDEDGQLSPAEIENASKSLIKLDKNGDGILSAEEMRPDPTQMPMFAPGGQPNNPPNPELMMRMFEGRDQNKDGKLTDDEIPPQMRERLSNIDQNNDGQIDRSEIEQAMRRLEGMRPGNRPDRPGTGGQNIQPRRPQADPAANKA